MALVLLEPIPTPSLPLKGRGPLVRWKPRW
jgi:hypothetical protein